MAKINRIDHLSIAVKVVDAARAQFGENILSLIQSVEEDGFVNKHIEKFGEGMHHLGLEVDDLEEFVRETEEKGFKIPLRDEFSNRSEIVLRPKDSLGVVLQILEWKGGSDATIEDRIKRIVELENIEN